jgi:hypothetical protein
MFMAIMYVYTAPNETLYTRIDLPFSTHRPLTVLSAIAAV